MTVRLPTACYVSPRASPWETPLESSIKQQPAHPPLVGNHSKVIRHQGAFVWQGIEREPYKETTDLWKGITRVVYVAHNDPHQFRNPDAAAEPFGFLCIVNADRDTPQAVDGAGPC